MYMRLARPAFALTGLLVLTLVLLAVAASSGADWINPWHPGDATSAAIYWQLRLPRVLTAFAVGGLLAVAGAWFQVMLQNPLAEPYILGVAGSAASGAVAASAVFPASAWAMPAGAFAGASLGIAVVGLFASLGPARLLLAGVVLAAFWAAVLALLLTLLPARALGRAFGWMLGDIASSPLSPTLLLAALAVSVLAGLWLSVSLDRLLLGEMQARALGVPIRRLHLGLLLGASAMTAVAVTAAGTIGFVGLVVPHLVRMLIGPMHRWLIPGAALAGGALLVVADTAARTVVAPAELPVGVLTALLGVPVFLFLLVHRR
jgi:iron complex transport system permease protein